MVRPHHLIDVEGGWVKHAYGRGAASGHLIRLDFDEIDAIKGVKLEVRRGAKIRHKLVRLDSAHVVEIELETFLVRGGHHARICGNLMEMVVTGRL